jgi:membrane-bound lytic murein transglycosylase B
MRGSAVRASAILGVLLAAPALAGPGDPAPPRPPGLAPAVIVPVVASDDGFRDWTRDFRRRALAQGIAPAVFDAAFADVHLNATVIDRDRHQNEFSKTIWDYLDSAVSDTRVANGRAAMQKNRRLLDAIEARYGVDAEVVAAIWGLESSYGAFRGSIPVVEALATLAYEGRRGAFFEAQLVDALRILQAGHVKLADFTGSWAGAMGHTQFIPSSFFAFAQDFRGDGRKDIWTDDPTDALASTAAYLASHGWTRGQPWGVEVTLPAGFDYRLSGERIVKPVAEWTALGLRDIDGRKLADHGPASVLLPAGARGAAFLIFDNFHVLETYNSADAYVIAVGSLSDRLQGGPAIRHGWPRDDRGLSFAEKKEMQGLLLAAGFDPQGVDGIMGPNTIQAIRLWQAAQGLVPDGYGSLAVLTRLRQQVPSAGEGG